MVWFHRSFMPSNLSPRYVQNRYLNLYRMEQVDTISYFAHIWQFMHTHARTPTYAGTHVRAHTPCRFPKRILN